MLHHNPSHPWTVAALADETGVSRAALARRFNELVGEPPMTFLTGWRIALAADLLREPGATIGSVADQVGYGSPFALSTAFKRVRGVSPREYRAARRSPPERGRSAVGGQDVGRGKRPRKRVTAARSPSTKRSPARRASSSLRPCQRMLASVPGSVSMVASGAAAPPRAISMRPSATSTRKRCSPRRSS